MSDKPLEQKVEEKREHQPAPQAPPQPANPANVPLPAQQSPVMPAKPQVIQPQVNPQGPDPAADPNAQHFRAQPQRDENSPNAANSPFARPGPTVSIGPGGQQVITPPPQQAVPATQQAVPTPVNPAAPGQHPSVPQTPAQVEKKDQDKK